MRPLREQHLSRLATACNFGRVAGGILRLVGHLRATIRVEDPSVARRRVQGWLSAVSTAHTIAVPKMHRLLLTHSLSDFVSSFGSVLVEEVAARGAHLVRGILP